jgi:uncharacterized Zn finger protein
VNLPRIKALAEAWARKNPELQSRLDRAVGLVAGVKYIGEDTYEVPGSKGQTYFVGVNLGKHTSTCQCEDNARGNHCKHRLAVALVWSAAR